MNIKEFLKTKKSKIGLVVLGSLIIFFLGLTLGMVAGFHKAKFSCDWGKNYERNFIRPPHGIPFSPEKGMMRGDFGPGFSRMDGRDFRNPHGVSGTIISVSGDNLVIKDRDDKENSVVVTSETLIKRGRETIKKEDLREGEQIVVLGNPKEDGSAVEAKLIRVLE